MFNAYRLSRKFFYGFSVLSLTSLSARAEFLAEPPYVPETGEWELSVRGEFAKANEKRAWRLPVSIEYGISDALEVEIGGEALVSVKPEKGERESGTGDMELGLRYSFLNLSENLYLALGMEFGLPTGNEDKDLGEGETTAEPYLIFGNDLSDTILAFAQVGMEHVFGNANSSPPEESADGENGEGEEAEDNNAIFAVVGIVSAVKDNLDASLEFRWQEDARYVAPGLILTPADKWQVGLAIAKGFGDEADDYRIMGKIHYEF